MDEIFIYTDGSCNTLHRIGAWASIILLGPEKKVLQGQALNTTHQRMELTAVIHTLEFLIENKLSSLPITLYTDSQYVMGLGQRKERLTASDFKTRKNNTLPNSDLINSLFCYAENLRLTIVKVKSHQKNSHHEQMNGEVDKLCRKMVRNLVKGQ